MGMGWYFRLFGALFGALNGSKNRWFARFREQEYEPQGRRFKP